MKKQSFIYVVIAGLLWGTSGIFAPILTPYGFTSVQMTAVRGLVSFVCLALYALIRDRSLFRAKPIELILFIGIGTAIFLTASCYYQSMQMTSAPTAVVLMYTAPVYVSVYSAVFFGERFSRLKLLSIALILIGCCLVSGIVGGLKFDAVGILLGILSGISYAAYNILTKIALRRGSSASSATVYSFLTMAIIGLCVSQPAGIVECAARAPAAAFALLIGMGICTCVLPYFLYTLGMRGISAGTASALGIIEPMATTVYSVAFSSRRLTRPPLLA